MNLKHWVVAPLDKERASGIAERHALPFFLAMMLEIRGVRTEEEIRALLEGVEELGDPFAMKDMDKAAGRIRQAIDEYERIAVYGDYDADGVTATAILYQYLLAQGADVVFYIPQREGEGYGMNPGAVHTLHEQGVKLIVTVDNGISSLQEVELARELGMDVVVTDHHRPHRQVPAAAAVVDAWQEDDRSPFKELCGAGVVLKLIMALEQEDPMGAALEYVELAAVGTIADVVPLVGENRAIVRLGLRALRDRPSPGIGLLLERCGGGERRDPTATGLAFTVIPRLNATGRMGTPDRAVKLLCAAEDEAEELVEQITEDNVQRRRVEAQIVEEAAALLEQHPEWTLDRVMVVTGHGWHHGVIGIVAAKITEKYGKPCFVVSEDGESAKGSGRSVEGFSLFEAVSSCADILERFGGHPMAAGATLRADKVEEFRRRLNEYAARVCPEMPAPVLRLDCRLNPGAVSLELPRILRRLEPFGSGNPQPLFGLFGMELREIGAFGGNGDHLKLTLQKKGAFLQVKRFGMKPGEFPFQVGDRVDLAVNLDASEYKGVERLTVIVRDMRLSGPEDGENIHSWRLYERLARGESLTPADAEVITPSREDLAGLYRLLAACKGADLELMRAVERLSGCTVGKLLVELDILEERGLAVVGPRDDKTPVRLVKVEGKVDILASPVYEKIREAVRS